MDDVRPPQLAEEQRPIPKLRHERPDVLDLQESIERGGRHGVDRHQPRLHGVTALPPVEHALRLHGLAPQDPQRRYDDGNAQSGWS